VPDLLVTGTDTGVGKTVIAAALVITLRERGIKAVGFKPAETGVNDRERSDSDILADASGERVPLAEPLLKLAEPLAPAVAADRAGTRLDARQLEARVDSLRRSGYSLIVEGAGGVLVPLAWDYTALDLAERVGLEAVIVGRAGLGTLNHVMLTVVVVRSRGIRIRGVVLNGGSDPQDLAEVTNPSTLARLIPDIPIIVVPRHSTADVIRATVPYVARLEAVDCRL